MAQLSEDKLEKAIRATIKVLSQKAVSFINMQLLMEIFIFYWQVVRFGYIFMKKLWDFMNFYLQDRPKTMLKKIPT